MKADVQATVQMEDEYVNLSPSIDITVKIRDKTFKTKSNK